MKLYNSRYSMLLLTLLLVLQVNLKAQGEIWQLKMASNTIFKPVTFKKLAGDTLSFEFGKERIGVNINSIDEIRNIKSNSDLPLKGAQYGSSILGIIAIIYYLVDVRLSFEHRENLSTANYYIIPLIGFAGGFIGAVLGGLLGTISWLASGADIVYNMNDLTSNQKINVINKNLLNRESNSK